MQAPDVGLKPRLGGIDVKGKGHMRTFWVSAGSGAPAAGTAAASFCCERALDALMPAGVEPVDRCESDRASAKLPVIFLNLDRQCISDHSCLTSGHAIAVNID
jgi:hypothetical protein